MDALILNGTDVRDKHFNQRCDGFACIQRFSDLLAFCFKVNTCHRAFRIQMAEKFVKAVAKPSRPDMNPIRYQFQRNFLQPGDVPTFYCSKRDFIYLKDGFVKDIRHTEHY